MSLCPEGEYRASLPDDEFWEYVLLGGPKVENPRSDPEAYDWTDNDDANNPADACPECGEWGACGYDSLGRPMIHSEKREDPS